MLQQPQSRPSPCNGSVNRRIHPSPDVHNGVEITGLGKVVNKRL
jgi:hypothetical protein